MIKGKNESERRTVNKINKIILPSLNQKLIADKSKSKMLYMSGSSPKMWAPRLQRKNAPKTMTSQNKKLSDLELEVAYLKKRHFNSIQSRPGPQKAVTGRSCMLPVNVRSVTMSPARQKRPLNPTLWTNNRVRSSGTNSVPIPSIQPFSKMFLNDKKPPKDEEEEETCESESVEDQKDPEEEEEDFCVSSNLSEYEDNSQLDPDSCVSFDEESDDVITSLEDDSIDESGSLMTSQSDDTKSMSPNDDVIREPALIESLFANKPSVINFVTHDFTIESHPYDVRKMLKWKMSSITPLIVKHTIARSGFKPTKKSAEWLGYFGKHMKSQAFKTVRNHQKVNHFPGSFQIGRKDRLWRNLSKMQHRFGKKEFGFMPQTYILPWDRKLLKNAWDDTHGKQKFILKPPAAARGIGIKVINKWTQIPQKKSVIVQKYLSRPYLINGSKFDLRVYVYVTSFDPLRAYVYENGLVRFATCKYSSASKHINNRYMHLTNYSINKKSGQFEQNEDINECQGHKWSISALWRHLSEKNINVTKIWNEIKDIIVKTLISVEPYTNGLIKSNCRRDYCCHEVFGFDIMLDEKLKAWLLEVNISPSLHSNSPLDIEIKGGMVKDMFNIAGFQIPTNKNLSYNSSTNTFSRDKRQNLAEITPETRTKHSFFTQNYKNMSQVQIRHQSLMTSQIYVPRRK